MINYLISHLKKQCWINLKLYFESYELSNLLEIFLNLF